jgi:hypothetical protein
VRIVRVAHAYAEEYFGKEFAVPAESTPQTDRA